MTPWIRAGWSGRARLIRIRLARERARNSRESATSSSSTSRIRFASGFDARASIQPASLARNGFTTHIHNMPGSRSSLMPPNPKRLMGRPQRAAPGQSGPSSGANTIVRSVISSASSASESALPNASPLPCGDTTIVVLAGIIAAGTASTQGALFPNRSLRGRTGWPATRRVRRASQRKPQSS